MGFRISKKKTSVIDFVFTLSAYFQETGGEVVSWDREVELGGEDLRVSCSLGEPQN